MLRTLHPRTKLLATGLAVAALALGTPLVAHAGVGDFFADMVKELMYIIIQFFGWLTGLLFKVLEIVAAYNGFTAEPIVVKGWTIVRDVCNMFFVFAMLLIAFGTILRVQAYHYRSLLFKVVLMAVLMNLSRSIVGVLIDLSQIVMLSFVAGFKSMAAGGLAQALGVDKILRLTPTATSPEGAQQALGVTGSDGIVASAGTLVASFILAAMMMGLIFVTVLAITVQLIVRVIKLWILTIMAPIAFAGTLFRGLGSVAGKWWDELTRELIAGPMLMFFLWLVLAISAANGGEVFGTDAVGAQFNPLNLEAASAGNLVNMFVVVGLLWAGLGVAKASGTAAAAAAGFGLAKLTQGRNLALRGTKATGAAVGRFAGRWTREAGSRTGVNTALATAAEGFKATGLGKAATYFSAEKTKARWERRALARQRREVTQFAGIEAAAANLGMEGTTSWVQSAKQRRGARFKAEMNKKVAERMKQLDERGITDDSTIRGALEGNMKSGKVVDEVQQMALMYKLEKQGAVKPSEASDLIIKYTAGMSNEAEARSTLKKVYRNGDTTRIKADGTVLDEGDLREEVSSNLVNDTRDAEKVKRFQGIDKRLAAVGDDGEVQDKVAAAMLTSDAFDSDYFDKLGKQRQAEVERAYVLAISNTKDAAKKSQLLDKFNAVTLRSRAAQEKALAAAEGDDKAKAKLERRFASASEVKLGDGGRLTGDPAVATMQGKLVLKQRNTQDREAVAKLASNKKLDDSEREVQQLAGAIDGARGHVDSLRVALSELATLDPEVDRSKWGDAVARVRQAQEALEEGAGSAATKLNKTYVDERGVEISPATMVRRSLGGDAAGEIDELSQRVLAGELDAAELQKRAASMNTGINARFSRLQPVVQKTGLAGKLTGGGWNERDQADLATFVPGMAKRYATPTQRVARVVERGGRTGLNPLTSDSGPLQRFGGTAELRGKMDAAFRRVTEAERSQELQPMVQQLNALVERLESVTNVDPVQGAKVKEIRSALDVVRGKPYGSMSKDEVAKILGDIDKLGGLA